MAIFKSRLRLNLSLWSRANLKIFSKEDVSNNGFSSARNAYLNCDLGAYTAFFASTSGPI